MSERKYVKTFRVVGETITRNGQPVKTLGDKIDKEINGFIAANPSIGLDDIILNTSLGSSTEHAVVTVLYTGELGADVVEPEEDAEPVGTPESAPAPEAPEGVDPVAAK